MRIGLDIDGVLANFAHAYQDLFVALTGKDLFATNDRDYPPCWDWPQYRGYTNDDVKAVWSHIKRDDTFWMNLQPFVDNTSALKAILREAERKHMLYFITDRAGMSPKQQTKMWLIDNLNYLGRAHTEPTVIISKHKGLVAAALELDAYIDDRFDNAVDVSAKSPTTRMYLLNRRYNQDFTAPEGVVRVGSLGTMLDKEIALGNL